MWERLIKTEILDDQGKLLKGNINDNELNKVLSPEFNCYKDRFLYLLKECIEREKFIHVPNNLRPFIEQHLESWINNAITAFFMKAGEDYVVDVDKTGSSQIAILILQFLIEIQEQIKLILNGMKHYTNFTTQTWM